MERRRWIGVAAVVVGIGVIVLAAFLALRVGTEEASPEDLARQWVAGSVDAVGEDIAGWMSAENTILRELGGEYVEDRIHDVIRWEYSTAERRSDGLYDLTATARVRFDIPGGIGEVDVAVPWEMVIDVGTESVSARPRWTGASLGLPGIPDGLDQVRQLATGVPAIEDRTRGELLKKDSGQTEATLSPSGLLGSDPTPAADQIEKVVGVDAPSTATPTLEGKLTSDPVSWPEGSSYAGCLDDVYLRAGDDYGIEHWLPAAVWYCRGLAPVPEGGVSSRRCVLDQMADVEKRYSASGERWGWWYAIAFCKPLPSADELQVVVRSGVQVTVYGACLDNAYLANKELVDNGEVLIGVSAWLCRDYLPEPPGIHLRRCDLERAGETKQLYPEWPERLHDWHAIMQCLPEWRPNEVPGESPYTTCLSDVYAQVGDSYDRKDRAIPAAVWRCQDHMPEPPAFYNPRCEINHRRRDEDSQLGWPGELYAWNAIVQCYPAYGGSR